MGCKSQYSEEEKQREFVGDWFQFILFINFKGRGKDVRGRIREKV